MFFRSCGILPAQVLLKSVIVLAFCSYLFASNVSATASPEEQLFKAQSNAAFYFHNGHFEHFEQHYKEALDLLENSGLSLSDKEIRDIRDDLHSRNYLLLQNQKPPDELHEARDQLSEEADPIYHLRFRLAVLLSKQSHQSVSEVDDIEQRLINITSSYQDELVPDHPELALVYFNIGNLYSVLRKPEETIRMYQNLIDMDGIAEYAPRILLMTKSNMSHEYIELNDYRRAFEAISPVPELNRRIPGNLQLGKVQLHYMAAWVSFNLGKAENKDEKLKQTIEWLQPLLDDFDLTLISNFNPYALKGYALQELQRFDEALIYLKKTMELEQKAGLYPGPLQADRYKSIAFNYSTRERHLSAPREEVFPVAVEYMQKAVEALAVDFTPESISDLPEPHQLEVTPITFEVISALGNILGGLYRSTENPEYARYSLAAYQLAISLLDEQRIELDVSDHDLRLESRKRGTYKNAAAKAYELYKFTGDKDYAEQVLTYFEQSRIWRLERVIRENQALRSLELPEEINQQKEEFRAQISELDRTYRTMRQDPDIGSSDYAPVHVDLMQKRRDLRDLIHQIEEDFPSFHQLRYREHSIDSKDIRQVLHEDEAVIGYFVQHHDLFSIFISRDEFKIHHHKDRELDFRSKIKRVHSLAGNRTLTRRHLRDEFVEKSATLYDLLIKPFEQYLDDIDKLTVLPDQQLYFLPFEVLLQSTTDEGSIAELDFLIKDYAIAYQYGLNFLFEDRRQPVRDRSYHLKALAPVFESGHRISILNNYITNSAIRDSGPPQVATLQHSETEVRQISRLFNTRNLETTSLLHQNAHLNVLRNPISTDILHIATHGIYNDEDPHLSSLILYHPETRKPDYLYATQISGLDLDIDLLVLSSCETGYGPLEYGEGIQALNRAFYQAGARNIIYSMWQVSDESTSELMQAFYTYLLDDHSYSRALQLAKLELLDDESTALPYYWSPFLYTGR